MEYYRPYHRPLSSSPPYYQLTKGSQGRIRGRDLGRGHIGFDLNVPASFILFWGRAGRRRQAREACVRIDRSVGLVVSAERVVSMAETRILLVLWGDIQ